MTNKTVNFLLEVLNAIALNPGMQDFDILVDHIQTAKAELQSELATPDVPLKVNKKAAKSAPKPKPESDE